MENIFNIGLAQYNKLNKVEVKFDKNKPFSEDIKAAILSPTLVLDNAYNDFVKLYIELISREIIAKKAKHKADKIKHILGGWFSDTFLVFKKDPENTDKLLFYMDDLQAHIETNRKLLIFQLNNVLMKHDKKFKDKTKELQVHEFRHIMIKLEICIIDCEVVNIMTKNLCGKKDNDIKQVTDGLSSIVHGLIKDIDETINLNTPGTITAFDAYISKLSSWRVPKYIKQEED